MTVGGRQLVWGSEIQKGVLRGPYHLVVIWWDDSEQICGSGVVAVLFPTKYGEGLPTEYPTKQFVFLFDLPCV